MIDPEYQGELGCYSTKDMRRRSVSFIHTETNMVTFSGIYLDGKTVDTTHPPMNMYKVQLVLTTNWRLSLR